MGVMLRKLDNRRHWDKIEFPWLGHYEIPADPIADLKTVQNNLSVYYIKEDRSNLFDVIEAIAASRDCSDRLDYLLFDQEVCSELNIEVENTRGRTPNQEVNKWHRDLTKLSADKLLELAKVIYEKGKTYRKQEKEIIKMLSRASFDGKIPIKDIKPQLRQKIMSTPLWNASSSSQ